MIIRKFEGRILQSRGQPVRVPIHVALSYDPDHDPLAVKMTFSDYTTEDVVVWTFALDLLQEGVDTQERIGLGDVKLRRASHSMLLICLTSPEGHADIGVSVAEVYGFLGSVQKESGHCAVRLDEELDLFIEEVLNG